MWSRSRPGRAPEAARRAQRRGSVKAGLTLPQRGGRPSRFTVNVQQGGDGCALSGCAKEFSTPSDYATCRRGQPPHARGDFGSEETTPCKGVPMSEFQTVSKSELQSIEGGDLADAIFVVSFIAGYLIEGVKTVLMPKQDPKP